MTKLFSISTDKSTLDLKKIHNYLCRQSYWAKGRTIEQVKTTIEQSLYKKFGFTVIDNPETVMTKSIHIDNLTP